MIVKNYIKKLIIVGRAKSIFGHAYRALHNIKSLRTDINLILASPDTREQIKMRKLSTKYELLSKWWLFGMQSMVNEKNYPLQS